MRQRPPVIANTRTAPIWPPAYTTSRIVARPDCNGGRHTPTASPSFAWACPASRRSCASPYPERNANRGRGPSSPPNASQTPIRTPKRPTYRPHFSPPSSSTVPVSYLKCSTIGSRHPLTRCLLTHPYLTHSSSSATAS